MPEGLNISDSLNNGTTYRWYGGILKHDDLYDVHSKGPSLINGLMSNLLWIPNEMNEEAFNLVKDGLSRRGQMTLSRDRFKPYKMDIDDFFL